MVERFNRSLLQLLRTYVGEKSDWERFFALGATCISHVCSLFHRSVALCPHFCRESKHQDFRVPDTAAHDPSSYQAQITCKMAQLRDFVETNLVHSAAKQQTFYNKHSRYRQFKVGDRVWLSISMAGKLDPKWEGRWKVIKVIGPINMKIHDGKRARVVHINRLQPRFQPVSDKEETQNETSPPWTPPQIEHSVVSCDDRVPPVTPRYLSRIIRPPEYF